MTPAPSLRLPGTPRLSRPACLSDRFERYLTQNATTSTQRPDIEAEMRSGAIKTATVAMQEVGVGLNEVKPNKQKNKKERQLKDVVIKAPEHHDRFFFLPSLLFEERVLRFDPAAYPFLRVLESEGLLQHLQDDHLVPENNAAASSRPRNTTRSSASVVSTGGRRGTSVWAASARLLHDRLRDCTPLETVYERFIREVVAPELVQEAILSAKQHQEVDPCEEVDAATSVLWKNTVCYQWPPTLRVFASEGKSLGRLHNDREYNHQPGEVNYWLPLASSLNLENTLWLESAEDRADWRPVLIGEGEVLRFHGTSCRHFTRKNASGVTRISLDFRCALKQHFRPDFQTGLSTHQHARRELLVRV